MKSNCKLLDNYLTGCKQQIKLQGWQILQKGVPKLYNLGQLLYNIFINELFYFFEHGTLYNYADDNHMHANNLKVKRTTNNESIERVLRR